jgi:hypothetical protein
LVDKKIQSHEIDVELKVMLIDAVATLYFIDENQNFESTDELLISIQKIPQANIGNFICRWFINVKYNGNLY